MVVDSRDETTTSDICTVGLDIAKSRTILAIYMGFPSVRGQRICLGKHRPRNYADVTPWVRQALPRSARPVGMVRRWGSHRPRAHQGQVRRCSALPFGQITSAPYAAVSYGIGSFLSTSAAAKGRSETE